MSRYHAVVWLDHAEAHVMYISRDEVEKFTAHSSDKHPHLHHKRGSIGAGHLGEDAAYFGEIIKLLDGAHEILLVGPGSAKLELVKYVHKHHAPVADRILGVETADHPTDGQVVAHAKQYFIARDNMLGKASGLA